MQPPFPAQSTDPEIHTSTNMSAAQQNLQFRATSGDEDDYLLPAANTNSHAADKERMPKNSVDYAGNMNTTSNCNSNPISLPSDYVSRDFASTQEQPCCQKSCVQNSSESMTDYVYTEFAAREIPNHNGVGSTSATSSRTVADYVYTDFTAGPTQNQRTTLNTEESTNSMQLSSSSSGPGGSANVSIASYVYSTVPQNSEVCGSGLQNADDSQNPASNTASVSSDETSGINDYVYTVTNTVPNNQGLLSNRSANTNQTSSSTTTSSATTSSITDYVYGVSLDPPI